MGVILGSAVVPIALCVTWKKANKWGCIIGAIAGFLLGVMAWLVATAGLNNGDINVTVRISCLFIDGHHPRSNSQTSGGSDQNMLRDFFLTQDCR